MQESYPKARSILSLNARITALAWSVALLARGRMTSPRNSPLTAECAINPFKAPMRNLQGDCRISMPCIAQHISNAVVPPKGSSGLRHAVQLHLGIRTAADVSVPFAEAQESKPYSEETVTKTVIMARTAAANHRDRQGASASSSSTVGLWVQRTLMSRQAYLHGAHDLHRTIPCLDWI